MKKKTFAIIFFLSIFTGTFAQIKSNYAIGFEYGFAEGYCYNRQTVDCFRPITQLSPLPRINENKENYTEGYNRGFQYGLDLKRRNNALDNSDENLQNELIQFNNYVSQQPVSAMIAIGMLKQRKYDARVEWMQNKMTNLVGVLRTLYQDFPEQDKIIKNETGNLVKKLKPYSASDFADDNVFKQIQYIFNSVERSCYNNYNYLVTQQNEIYSMENEVEYSGQKATKPLKPTVNENIPRTQSVVSYAPIFKTYNLTDSDKIGYAKDNKVEILEKYNDNIYKVKCDGVVGYMAKTWFTN